MNNSNNRENNRESDVEKIEEDPIQELVGDIELDFDFCSLSNLFLKSKKELAKKINQLQELLLELPKDTTIENNDLVNYCKAVVWFFDKKNEKEVAEKTPITTDHLLILLENIFRIQDDKVLNEKEKQSESSQTSQEKQIELLSQLKNMISQLDKIKEGVVSFDTLIIYINEILGTYDANILEQNKELCYIGGLLFKKWASSIIDLSEQSCSFDCIFDPYVNAREQLQKMALCIVTSHKEILKDNLSNALNIFQANKNDLDRLLFFSLYELQFLRELPIENQENVKNFIEKNKKNFLNNKSNLKNTKEKYFEKLQEDWKELCNKFNEIENWKNISGEDISEKIKQITGKIDNNIVKKAPLSKQEWMQYAILCHPDKLNQENKKFGEKLFIFLENFYKQGQHYGEEKDFNVSIEYIKKMNPSPQKLILVVNELLKKENDLTTLQECIKNDINISCEIREFFDVIKFKEASNNGLKIQINKKKAEKCQIITTIFSTSASTISEISQKNMALMSQEEGDLDDGEKYYNQYIEMLRIWNNPSEKLKYIQSERSYDLKKRLGRYEEQIIQLEKWQKNYQNFKHSEYIQRKMNLARKFNLIVVEKSLVTNMANVAYSLFNRCGQAYRNWTDSVEAFKTTYKAKLYQKLYEEEYELGDLEEKQEENYNETTEILPVDDLELFEDISQWSDKVDTQIKEFQEKVFREEDELIKAASLIDTEMEKAYLEKKNKLDGENAEKKKVLDKEYDQKWGNAQERLQAQKNKNEEKNDEYLKAIEKRDHFDKNIVWKNMYRIYEQLDTLEKVKTKGVSAIPGRIDELVKHFRKYFLEEKDSENFMTEHYFSDKHDHDCFLQKITEEKEKYVAACKDIIPHFGKTNKEVLNDVVIFCLYYLEKVSVSKGSIRDSSRVKDLFIDLIVRYEDFLHEDTKEKCENFIDTVSPMTLLGVGAAFGLDEADDRYEKMATKIGMLKSKFLSVKLFQMFKKAAINSQKSLCPTQLISWMRWYNLERIALGTGELECIKNLYQILKKKCNDDGGVFLVKDRLITNVWGTSESLKPVLEYYTVMKNEDSSSKKVLDQLKSILLLFFSDYELFCAIKEGEDQYDELKTGLKNNLCNEFVLYCNIVTGENQEGAEKVLEMYKELSKDKKNALLILCSEFLEELNNKAKNKTKLLELAEKIDKEMKINPSILKKREENILSQLQKILVKESKVSREEVPVDKKPSSEIKSEEAKRIEESAEINEATEKKEERELAAETIEIKRESGGNSSEIKSNSEMSWNAKNEESKEPESEKPDQKIESKSNQEPLSEVQSGEPSEKKIERKLPGDNLVNESKVEESERKEKPGSNSVNELQKDQEPSSKIESEKKSSNEIKLNSKEEKFEKPLEEKPEEPSSEMSLNKKNEESKEPESEKPDQKIESKSNSEESSSEMSSNEKNEKSKVLREEVLVDQEPSSEIKSNRQESGEEESNPGNSLEIKLNSKEEKFENPLEKESEEPESEKPDQKIESKSNSEESSSEIKSEPDSNEEPGSNSESRFQKVEEPLREIKIEEKEKVKNQKLLQLIANFTNNNFVVVLSLIDVCLQSLDKEDKNQFMQNEITKLISYQDGLLINEIDFCQNGNHLIKEILHLCYDTLIDHVDKNNKIEFKEDKEGKPKNEEDLQHQDVKDFVKNYNLFLDQKTKHTGYYSPTKLAFSIFTGIPAGAALMLPYICQKSPQISAFVDSMLSKDFGSKVVQVVGNMRDVFSGMTVMSKPIGKQIASFIYSKRAYDTLGLIGLCVLLYSLHKIISEWHLRGEKIKLDSLTLKSNQSIEKLTGQCEKIFGSTLKISKINISEGFDQQIFCYKYNNGFEENIKQEELLPAEFDEKEEHHEKPKHQFYSDLKGCLDQINTLSDLFSEQNSGTTKKENAVLLPALVNTLYCPVQPSLNATGTPGRTDSGPKQGTGFSGKDRMECINLFKDKVCDLAIKNWQEDINNNKINNHNYLEDIFDATYIDDGASCYFTKKNAIENIKHFVSSKIDFYLDKKNFIYKLEDVFHNESLAVKKFLQLRNSNDAANVLKKIKGNKFEIKESQDKQDKEQASLKTLVDEIKKKNASSPVLVKMGKVMRKE